jgi:hypothetical protein
MTTEEATGTEAAVIPFTLARVGGRLVKLAATPEDGAEGFSAVVDGAAFVTDGNAHSLTKEQLGELYGEVAGTQAKKFKDKQIAVESLAYQASKMSTYDPSAPTPAAAPAKGAKVSKAKKEKAEPKATKLELLTPEDAAARLKALPPQCASLISAMSDVVKAKGSQEFELKELEARLSAPDSPLTTRQPPMRICSYYSTKLKDACLIREV